MPAQPGFYPRPNILGPPEWIMEGLKRSMLDKGRLQDELQGYYQQAMERPGQFQQPWKQAFADQWQNKLMGRNVPGQAGQMFQRGLSDVAKQQLMRAIGRGGHEKWRGFQLARPEVQALGRQGIGGLLQSTVNPAQALQLLAPEIQSNLKAIADQDQANIETQNMLASSGGGGGGGGKVLCTVLHDIGVLPDNIYQADSRQSSKIPRVIQDGYWTWGVPVARLMRRRKWAMRFATPFVLAWAYQMAYREGATDRPNYFGILVESIGIPICYAVGKIRHLLDSGVKQPQYEGR